MEANRRSQRHSHSRIRHFEFRALWTIFGAIVPSETESRTELKLTRAESRTRDEKVMAARPADGLPGTERIVQVQLQQRADDLSRIEVVAALAARLKVGRIRRAEGARVAVISRRIGVRVRDAKRQAALQSLVHRKLDGVIPAAAGVHQRADAAHPHRPAIEDT